MSKHQHGILQCCGLSAYPQTLPYFIQSVGWRILMKITDWNWNEDEENCIILFAERQPPPRLKLFCTELCTMHCVLGQKFVLRQQRWYFASTSLLSLCRSVLADDTNTFEERLSDMGRNCVDFHNSSQNTCRDCQIAKHSRLEIAKLLSAEEETQSITVLLSIYSSGKKIRDQMISFSIFYRYMFE